MDDAKALKDRLGQFAAPYSRAEIARKTGTSVMNVGRYLKGTRVPAEFCMALVREFGVNAGWLMAGQGGPYVSDLATQHGEMAGNLLELVEAMSAVTRMRLGSFAGQDHMKLLRQLNDSLGTYERLREKLNNQSRGILGDILHELQGALASMDMARAGALRKAAEQVARMCDDDALTQQLLTAQAHHAYLAGRMDESMILLRKRFVHSIGDAQVQTEEQAQSALRLVIVLNDSGRSAEAMRIAHACLALAGDNALPSVAAIGTFCGHMHGTRGEVAQAMQLIERWLPHQQGRARGVSQAALAKVQLLAGVLAFEEALKAPGLPQPLHAHVLSLACAMEDVPAIRACMKFVESNPGRELKERTQVAHFGTLLARALERADKATLRDCAARRIAAAGHARPAMEWSIYEAQLSRVLGEKSRAAQLCTEAQSGLSRFDPGSVDIALLAQHWRNQIALGGKAEQAAARRQLEAAISGGCRLFAPLLGNG